jgi:hypothetical protein
MMRVMEVLLKVSTSNNCNKKLPEKVDYVCAMWLMLECHILYWTFVIYKKVKVVTFFLFPKVRYLQLYFLPLSPCSYLILSYLKIDWLIQQECIGVFYFLILFLIIIIFKF